MSVRGVYLNLKTTSENLDLGEHFIWNWGGISESKHITWKFGSQCALDVKWGVYLDLVEHFIWKLDLVLPSVSNGLSLTTWISEEFNSCHWQFLGGYIWERRLKIWNRLKFYSCFTEGLFVLHTKDLMSTSQGNSTWNGSFSCYWVDKMTSRTIV